MADPWDVVAETPAAPTDPWAVVAEKPVKAARAAAPAPKPKATFAQDVNGFMANLNRSLMIGDEVTAGAHTVGNVLTGKVPLSGAVNDFSAEMGKQRATEADFAARHPVIASGVAKGIGNSATMLIPSGPTMQGSRLANMGRGALTAATTAAVSGLTDSGTINERLHAANRNAFNPVTLGLGAAFGALAPTAPKAVKPNAVADNVAAFDKAGVRPSLAATGGKGSAATAKAVAENPIAGVRARAALQGSLDDTEAAAARTAGKFGAPTSRGAAGEAVQAGVQGFNSRFSKRASKLYDDAFAAIDTGQTIAVSQAKNAADLRNANMANFQAKPAPVIVPAESAATLQAMGGRVNANPLSAIITDPRVSKIASALEAGKQDLRFGDLRALRTWVREAQANPELRQGIDQAGLQRLEQSLTSDITTNAENLAGPAAARRLKQADQFYRLGSQRITGALQNFVGKGSAAPKAGEATYDLIVRAAGDKGGADTARLVALKKSLQPHEWGDIAATTVERMGKPLPGVADAETFSVNRFATNYASLSERGKDLLFGKGPLRDELENLNRVVGMQKNVERAANSSKSAVSAQAVATLAGLVTPHGALPTAGALGGMAVTGEAMTNPAFVRWLAAGARPVSSNPATAAAQRAAVARLARLAGIAGAQSATPAPRLALATGTR